MKKIVSMAIVLMLALNTIYPLTSLAIADANVAGERSNNILASVDDGVVAKDNPGISKLEILPQQGKRFIHADTYYKDGFEGDVFEYNYYLLSHDTKDLKLKVSVDLPKYTLDVRTTDIDGLKSVYNVIDDTSLSGELDFNAGIIKSLDITVNLGADIGGGIDSFTYTINIIPSMVPETDPKIHLSVKKDIGSEYAELLVTLENVHTSAFSFNVYNTTPDVKFTDKNGQPFTDASQPLQGNPDNFYELQMDTTSLDYMRSNGQMLFITASSKGDNGILKAEGDDGLDVYKFRMSAEAATSANDIIQNLSLVAGDLNDPANILDTINANVLFDYRYIDVRQRVTVDTDENIKRRGSKDSTLVYIDAGNLKKVEAYVRHLTSDDLVEFVITNKDDKTQITPAMKLNGGKLTYALSAGTYSLNINSRGYLEYTKDGIQIYEDRDTFLSNIILIAGDVDGNGDIDGSDRSELLKVYNHSAVGGVVNIAGNIVAADFNNDSFVNAIDLGELLRNIGRYYK